MCNYLSVYFLLTTRYGWREWEISQKLEKPAYALAFVIVATYVSCAAGLGAIQPTQNTGLCSAFGHAFIWIYDAILTIFAGGGCVATYMVYRHVYVVTQASRTHDASFAIPPPSSSQQRQEDQRQARVRRVARQAIAYYIALLNTLLWPAIYNVLVQYTDIEERAHKPAIFLFGFVGFFLYPLQGACNFVIYIQYRVKSWKRSYPQVSWITATWWAVVKPMDPPNNINSNLQTSTHTASSMLNSASAAMWSIPGARRVSQLLSLPFSSHFRSDRNHNLDEISSSSDEEEFAEDDDSANLPWWQRNIPAPTQQEETLSSVGGNESNPTQSTALEAEEKPQQVTPHEQVVETPQETILVTEINLTLEEADLAAPKEYKSQVSQPEQDIETPQETITENNPTPEEAEVYIPREYNLQVWQPEQDNDAPEATISDNHYIYHAQTRTSATNRSPAL
ncbi:expressed unknown protein [Seminavis robusta]|uniref:Uncharacterized protein n=1 Tax=Seminavis robusta TaxID=568900 RepID=A0A9N8D6N5_9STRA|nr:expressed unknown protein [Seminavis robusta]|eukprot:Sro1_g000650.1 n/a (451) ;mRNA; f:187695-189047